MDLGKIETLVSAILEHERAELVDLEHLREGGKWVLRLYVDKEGGVTLDDCEYLSDRVGAALDSSDVIERSYVLEISSPGLDRVIKKDRDFQRFEGSAVRVTLSTEVEGRRRLAGRLLGLQGGEVLVETEGRTWRVPRCDVAEVRLDDEAQVEADLKREKTKERNSPPRGEGE
ncbi:MAG: ribosome maturation factor RimP [Elusimicrobia bacterium]|nr:ribosome maturation factor RimP [Elusimicrobiota bacterium]